MAERQFTKEVELECFVCRKMTKQDYCESEKMVLCTVCDCAREVMEGEVN